MLWSGTARPCERRLADAGAWSVGPGQTIPLWAVFSAALAPVLLMGGWLIADALQPVSYSPIHETVSALAGQGGTDRWVMTSALFLVGGLYLVTAAGLSLAGLPSRALLTVAGLASMGIALSPEPVAGTTTQHLAWTVLGAITIAIWPAFIRRRTDAVPLVVSWYATIAVTILFIGLLGWLVSETQGGTALGLAERLTVSVQSTWPFIVALALRRSTSRTAELEPG
ncbi:MAG TPA: DUF998 domain-containing protein [Streptosporangiaceae bacterium]|nr:DUF998 domain-containing protein [Streptosporangiaceae bacterium]